MVKSFSLIEKDDKSYEYVQTYISALNNSEDLFGLDLLIQRNELTEHLQRNNKMEDQKEMTWWIENNSQGLRCWINSLKMLSMFMFFAKRLHENVNFERPVFDKFVDLWNLEKQCVCDTIKFFEK